MLRKVEDVLDLLRRDGWVQVGQKGSHRQFTHPSKPGRATVAGRPSTDEMHLAGMREDGDPIPPPTAHVNYVDVAA